MLETSTAVRNEAGDIVAYQGILRDVTAQRRLETQVRQAAKMEAVGRFAGGIAHDFNNLLTLIKGYAELLEMRLEPRSPDSQDAHQIISAADRAAALTRQLLAFTRQQVLEPKVLDLNQRVREVDKMLRRVIGEDVEVRLELAPNLGRIRADPTQIDQIVMNLAVNARDAMPEGGSVTFKTTNVELDSAFVQEHLGAKAGPFVLLEVTDTGVGMDAATRSRVFEPFFTTKPKGEGTGLGLSTVYGIVQQSNGQIRVDSEPGRGATFEIFLPAAKGIVAKPVEPEVDVDSPRGTETILLVEDEVAVRSLLRRFLDSQGYCVLEASDGETALEQAETSSGEIDLLLTDLVMPGMGGFELARRMESRWPDLRILYMSGYSDHAVGLMGTAPVLDATSFLQKPFSTDLLARRLRAVLDAA